MFAPHKVLRNLVFHFSCGALIVLWAISGYHSLALPFPHPHPPPQKKTPSSQHLIRTLLLVIEVFRGEIKGNAHAKVFGEQTRCANGE